MPSLLTAADIRLAAVDLGIDYCALVAVIDVESGGSGFNADGSVKIQFEGHVFWSKLEERGIDPRPHMPGNGDILYRRFTSRYVLGQKAEYDQFRRAAQFNEEAAMLATSWGMFQVMGFNHKVCGFDTVQAFVEAQKESEARQLQAFCAFVRSKKLLNFLSVQDWAGFAYRYNGPGYAEHNYDGRLRGKYERCKTTS
jgi:hypothetical protein